MCKKREQNNKIINSNKLEELMSSTLDKLKTLVDVNVIVGDPIINKENVLILPISRVSVGLVAGGGEIAKRKKQKTFPFAGGSGAGVNVIPIGFLVINNGVTSFIKVENRTNLDKLSDLLPELIKTIKSAKNNTGNKNSGKKQ